MSLPKKIVRLDSLISIYVRSKDAKTGSFVKCYTCGEYHNFSEIECGHFIERRHKAVRFDLNNLRPQCKKCNNEKRGNLVVYEEKLKAELGEQKFNELIALGRTTKHWSQFEIDALISMFKQLIKSNN